MALCKKCGIEIDEGLELCEACKAAEAEDVKEAPVEEAPAVEEASAEAAAETVDIGAKIQQLNDTVDTTAEFDQADIEGNKVMGVLAYLGILVLVPILAAKQSKFARFHANQGLVLFLTNIIYNIATSIIGAILAVIKLSALSIILDIAGLAFLVLAIIGIVNVVNGKAKQLPIIGKIVLIK